MPIDYSKWDRLEDSSASDDGDDDIVHSDDDERPAATASSSSNQRPQVTRLERPSSISITPHGVVMNDVPQRATATPFVGAVPAANTHSSERMTRASESTAPPVVRSKEDDQREEDEMMFHNLTRNGGSKPGSHLWAQSREDITVSFLMSSVQIRSANIASFRVVQSETDENIFLLSFSVQGEVQLAREFQFRYPIVLEEETSSSWQLHSLPSRSLRLLVLQVRKKPVAQGMYLWWEQCFVGDPAIDTTKIEGRTQSSVDRGLAFQQAWQAAHQEFRDKRKQH